MKRWTTEDEKRRMWGSLGWVQKEHLRNGGDVCLLLRNGGDVCLNGRGGSVVGSDELGRASWWYIYSIGWDGWSAELLASSIILQVGTSLIMLVQRM